MTFEEYERERIAFQGAATHDVRDGLIVGALGLAGEAGEAVELIKKHAFHGKLFEREKLLVELGDVLWYVMYLANKADSSLEEVARLNNAKLRARYPNGFSVEAAAARSVEP